MLNTGNNKCSQDYFKNCCRRVNDTVFGYPMVRTGGRIKVQEIVATVRRTPNGNG